jgi:S-adenosylmethionine hydrolase
VAIITLTSDIGTKDYLPGAVKGRLLSINSSFIICDISHNISPFNYNEAVYIVRNSFSTFPLHTWHLLLVNLFDSARARLLLAFHGGHYFACADNGLLPMIFDEMPEQVIAIRQPPGYENNVLSWITQVGNAIQAVENGKAFNKLGEEAEHLVEKHNLKPLATDDFLEGRIIYIDNFENVVVNITRQQFELVRNNRSFTIIFKGDEVINRLSDSYADVPEGSKLAFFNTAGYLEIAVNKGNAAGLFGLQPYNSNANPGFVQSKIFYQTVRVYFDK